jgi:hypothetical protein
MLFDFESKAKNFASILIYSVVSDVRPPDSSAGLKLLKYQKLKMNFQNFFIEKFRKILISYI